MWDKFRFPADVKVMLFRWSFGQELLFIGCLLGGGGDAWMMSWVSGVQSDNRQTAAVDCWKVWIITLTLTAGCGLCLCILMGVITLTQTGPTSYDEQRKTFTHNNPTSFHLHSQTFQTWSSISCWHRQRTSVRGQRGVGWGWHQRRVVRHCFSLTAEWEFTV